MRRDIEQRIGEHLAVAASLRLWIICRPGFAAGLGKCADFHSERAQALSDELGVGRGREEIRRAPFSAAEGGPWEGKQR
jgi:hypothetical protein